MIIDQDYFELFGLERGFDIDSDRLVHRYRDLQKVLHPDRFASASDQERRLAMQQAAEVNAGYQTLRDPLQRARYLLRLAGREEAGEQATLRDPEFLEEQMELREALAELRGEADPQGAILRFLGDLNARERDYVEALRQAFDDGGEEALDRAATLVQKLQFVRRLQQEAEAVEESLY